VSVTTSFLSDEFAIRSSGAAPRAPGCVQQAMTSCAPAARDRVGGRADRARSVDDVVDDDGDSTGHLADDLHLGDLVRRPARRLSMIARFAFRPFGERARALDAAGVGRDRR
jgi:hypothetical protein